MSLTELLKALNDAGIKRDDPRLGKFLHAVRYEELQQPENNPTSNESISDQLDRETFKK
ncbi:unnamed protein product [Gongylonema pulchrum]|uniref:Glutaminase EF-hand domain-containing protein n=1 Tax=Gongylonema pulchrum TaxID=637853 RepID=A0A3P6PUK4_9BILA|nr:unnamed protein product [Gongylonema pulchrum]